MDDCTSTSSNQSKQDSVRETLDLESIKESLEKLEHVSSEYETGDTLIDEEQPCGELFFIVEGRVNMFKTADTGVPVYVDHFESGHMIGLSSYWLKTPSFLKAVAESRVHCLRIPYEEADRSLESNPALARLLHKNMIHNLTNRYRRMVSLNLEITQLGETLERERNELRRALEEIEQTRSELIQKEKLATLGQLLAGVAHELNNPCASLNQSVDSLAEQLKEIVPNHPKTRKEETPAQLIEAGEHCPFLNSNQKQERLEAMENQLPKMKRSMLRRLACVEPGELKKWMNASTARSTGDRPPSQETLNQHLEYYELGIVLRRIRLAGERIQQLVTSVKNYGRSHGDQFENMDLREGLQDTLHLLNHKLRHYTMDIVFDEIPRIRGNQGLLNQVWTNLLVNACEATPPPGRIRVSCEQKNAWVLVTIQDSGRGLPADASERLFENNYTTKKDKGMGLGLSLSKDIIEKHGGKINACNATDGGAMFLTWLPVLCDKF